MRRYQVADLGPGQTAMLLRPDGRPVVMLTSNDQAITAADGLTVKIIDPPTAEEIAARDAAGAVRKARLSLALSDAPFIRVLEDVIACLKAGDATLASLPAQANEKLEARRSLRAKLTSGQSDMAGR